jgi:hypothetical protein
MPALPRLIVADPMGLVQEQVRAAVTLIDRVVIQIDVPTAESALDELGVGQAAALIPRGTWGTICAGGSWRLALPKWRPTPTW